MALQKFLNIVAGKLKQVAPTLVGGSGSYDGMIPALDSNGLLNINMMPAGIGNTKTITSSENLTAGDFVNIHISTGVKVRKADASSSAKQAHGFVLATTTSGNPAIVYPLGALNNQMTGLTAGTEYYLSHSTPGGVVVAGSLTTTATHIQQFLGIAGSTTEIVTNSSEPVELV